MFVINLELNRRNCKTFEYIRYSKHHTIVQYTRKRIESSHSEIRDKDGNNSMVVVSRVIGEKKVRNSISRLHNMSRIHT